MLNRHLLIIIILSAILVLPWISVRDFSTKGEPRESLTARAMLETGNWILPARLGEELPTKPPLTHWLIAGSATLFGELSEGSSRFPSAVLSIFAVWLLFNFVRSFAPPTTNSSLSGDSRALIACIVLLLSIEWHRASLTTRIDMTLSTFIFMAIVGGFNWEKREFTGFPWQMFTGLVFATLAKGPVGVALPCAICFFYYLGERRPWSLVISALLKVAIPAIAITGLWYVLAYQQAGETFLNIVIDENLGRILGRMNTEGGTPHAHGASYLLMTLLLGLLPWTLIVVPALIFQSVQYWADCGTPKFFSQKLNAKAAINRVMGSASSIWSKLPPPTRLSVISIALFVAFFSLVTSKRSVYLLPIYPFWALLIAYYLIYLARHKVSILVLSSRAFGFTLLGLYILGLLVFFGCIDLSFFIKSPKRLNETAVYLSILREHLSSLSPIYICLLILPAALCLAALSKKTKSPWLLAIGAYYALSLTLDGVIYPGVAEKLSAKSFAQTVREVSAPQKEWFNYGNQLYGMSYYLGQDLPEFNPKEIIHNPTLVLLLERHFENLLRDLPQTYIVSKLARSERGVEKPLDYIILVKVENE